MTEQQDASSADVKELIAAVNKLTAGRRVGRVIIAVLALVVIGMGVGGVYLVRNASDQGDLLKCVSDYANNSYNRSSFLQKYLIPRNQAENDFEIAIANNAPKVEVDARRKALIKATARYNQAYESNALPKPPKLACSSVDSLQSPNADPDLSDRPAPPVIPTDSASPSPRPSQSPHAQAPAPGRSVPDGGGGVTTTAARTRTVRAEAPAPPRHRTHTPTAPRSTKTVTKTPTPRPSSTPTARPLLGGVITGICHGVVDVPALCRKDS